MRVFAVAVCAALALGMLGGCSGSGSQGQNQGQSQAGNTSEQSQTESTDGYAIVSAEDVASLPKGTLLVDTRTPEEFDEGHIPGALNASYPKESGGPCAAENNASSFKTNWKALDVDDLDGPIVLYCRTGVRASSAAKILVSQGYTNVSVYEGSWVDWTSDSSRPIES